MTSFGLGLVLNFTDNASSGMQQAARNFESLNALSDDLVNNSSSSMQVLASAGFAMSMVGDQIVSAGSAITESYAGMLNTITQTGTTILTAQTQLSKLYGSSEAGAEMLGNIKEYAKDSIFNFENLIPSVIMLKANGIEAFDAITSSTGKSRQMLMDYAADLAAFNPEMRNMYGTGIQAAMGAINEYIAEGNAMSLQKGASLDILGILGEDKGSTIEERSVQIADLLEKLNMVGMTASLAGTPMQRLSNAQDVWFDILTRISDSGVFEKYTELIAKFTDYIFAIPDDELQSIAEVIGSAFVSIMSPLESLVDAGLRLLDWFRGLVKENPTLARFVITMGAFAGAALLISGIALKAAGGIFMLASSFMFVSQAGGIVPVLRAVAAGFLTILRAALPVVAVAGILYIAWKNNLFGIRDLVTNVFGQLYDIITITMDALADNTLSEEQFIKARDLGILPFIESLLDLKYEFGIFIDGFKRGFQEAVDTINDFLGRFDTIKVNLYDAASVIGESLQKIAGVDFSTWDSAGEAAGKITTAALVIYSVVKVVGVVIGFFRTVWGVITTIVGVVFKIAGGVSTAVSAIGSVVSGIVSFFSGSVLPVLQAIGSAISGAVTAIAGALGISVGWVVAIIAAIVAVVAIIVVYRDKIWEFLKNVGSSIAEFFSSVKDRVVELWNNLIDAIVNSPVVQTISAIIDGIVDIFFALVDVAKQVWDIIVQVVQIAVTIISGIFNIIYQIGRIIFYGILYVAQQVWNFISSIISTVAEVFQSVWTAVSEVVKEIFQNVTDFFVNLWETAVATVTPIIQKISSVASNVADKVKQVFNSAKNIVTGAFGAIKSAAETALGWISDKLRFISDALSTVKEGIGNFFSGVGNVFAGAGNKLQSAVGLNTGGYVKGEGLTYLHPNEVVVNGPMTRNLNSFLDDYVERRNNPSSSTVSPLGMSDGDGDPEEIVIDLPSDPPFDFPVTPRMTSAPASSPMSYDYSVTFTPGSIVLQAGSMSDAELQAAAEKLMKIIERKQQLKAMSTRR